MSKKAAGRKHAMEEYTGNGFQYTDGNSKSGYPQHRAGGSQRLRRSVPLAKKDAKRKIDGRLHIPFQEE
jgi:hypothetical protein